jgi:glycerol-3-phosphate cytidylyltransferase
MKKVITYGTFDDLHEWHIRLLKRAKKLWDTLIVWLSSDEFNRWKWKETIHSWEIRKEQLETLPYVAKVIKEESWEQKISDIQKYDINIFTIGDDWKWKFDFLKKYCEVIYLPRTKWISTTQNKQYNRIHAFAWKSKKIFEKVFTAFFIILCIPLSYIIPKNKNLYVFWSINGKEFSGNSKACFEYYKERKICKYISDIRWYTFIIPRNSCVSFWYIFRAQYIFLDGWPIGISFLYFLLWNFKIIKLWHGETLKKINFSSKIQTQSWGKIDTFFIKKYYQTSIKAITCCSTFSKSNMEDAFLTDKVYITWLARNDTLLQKHKKKIFGSLNKKIILYAPTWRDSCYNLEIFSKKFLENLDSYLEQSNSLFVIKWHINSHIHVPFLSKNIIDISWKSLDIQEILQETDVLITDYSSIYIDFLLTNRPILFYAYDLENYLSKDREMYLPYKEAIIPSWLSLDETQLMEHIIWSQKVFQSSRYQREYQQIKNFFHHFQDAHSTKRLDAILSMIK